jgi:hypothetical protein
MEIKGNGRGCPRVPYHKPPTPLSKNSQNHPNHQTQTNLMDIKGHGTGCPRRALAKTTKTSKKISKSDGNRRK